MHTRIICPGCQRSYAATDRVRGKSVRCPSCHTKFTVPAGKPPATPKGPDIPQAVAYTEEAPNDDIVYVAEELPAARHEPAAGPAAAARQRHQADAAEVDDAGWVLPAGEIAMPASVRVAMIALALGLVSELAAGWLSYANSGSSRVGTLIQLAIALPIIGLLLLGMWYRNRLAWQWGRILAPLGAILAALGAAGAVVALFLPAARALPQPAGSLWLLLGLLASEVVELSVIFFAMGRPAARRHFGLMCPECGSFRCRPEDFWFHLVRCRSCRSQWTAAPTVLKGRLEDRGEAPLERRRAGDKARRRKQPAVRPRSRSRMWVGITAAVLGVALVGGLGYLAVTRLLPVFRQEIDAAEWRDYVPPGGNLKVKMPGTPKYTQKVEQAGADRLLVHTHEVRAGWPERSFSVSYSDYPPHVIGAAPAEARLDGARNGMVKAIAGTVRSEKHLTLNGFPGREVEIEVPGKGSAMVRLYAVDPRIYILGVDGAYVKPDSPDVKRFFDSFQLQTVNRPNAPAQPNRPNTPIRRNRPNPLPPQAPQLPPEPPPGPYVPTPVQRVAIKPPSLNGDKVTVPLRGPVHAVAVGGGGRYLILHQRSARHLAVFDANEAKVVKEIFVPELQVFVAAGMDKLIVALPQRGQLRRYSLTTFQQDATAPLPLKSRCTGIALGSASNGPLLLEAFNPGQPGERRFFDIVQMKPVGIVPMKQVGVPNGQAVPPNMGARVRLHAAADGSVFTVGNQSFVLLKGSGFDTYQVQAAADLLPGPDGRTLYSSGQMFTAEGKAIGPNVSGHGHAVWYLPAVHGPYYVSLNEARANDPATRPMAPRPQINPRGGQFLSLSVHRAGDRQPLVTLPRLDALDGLVNWISGMSQPLDQHLFLIPDAQLLVILPLGKNQLVLHRCNLTQLTEGVKGAAAPAQPGSPPAAPVLVVTSSPPPTAVKGKPYVYPLVVKAKKGGVQYKLESGPDGMTVGVDGRVSWAVPADFAEAEVTVILTVRDAAGQEVYHTFAVAITDKG